MAGLVNVYTCFLLLQSRRVTSCVAGRQLACHVQRRGGGVCLVSKRRASVWWPISFNLFRAYAIMISQRVAAGRILYFTIFGQETCFRFQKYHKNSCPHTPLQHLHATLYPSENTFTSLTPTSHPAAQITLIHNGNQQVSCRTANLVFSSKVGR